MQLSPGLEKFLVTDADPGFRAVALTQLLGRSERDAEVVAARAESLTTGWVHRTLSNQLPDGQWDAPGTSAGELYLPKYVATNWRLLVLADLGLTIANPAVEKAARLLLDRYGGPEGGEFGGGNAELCFTGNGVRMMTRFGLGHDPRVRRGLDWLLRTQRDDGGWHCFPADGKGTLDGWEALAAFAATPTPDRPPAMRRSIERGAEFYLARGLLREGETPYAPWERFHYPPHYYYDVLVGLDMLTALGYGRDDRLVPLLDLLETRRNADGTWNIDASHPDIAPGDEYQPNTPVFPFVLEMPGTPSRWITLRALRVLDRAGRLP